MNQYYKLHCWSGWRNLRAIEAKALNCVCATRMNKCYIEANNSFPF